MPCLALDALLKKTMLIVLTCLVISTLSKPANSFCDFSPRSLLAVITVTQILTFNNTKQRKSKHTESGSMWSGCVALALGETSSVKYLMLEAFSPQTQSTWDNSGRSRAGVNQQQCRMAISGTHKNTINTVCWLSIQPCRLTYENKKLQR